MLAIIDKAMKKGHEYVSWSRFEVNRGIVLVNKIFLMEGEMQPIEATSCGRLCNGPSFHNISIYINIILIHRLS